MHRFVWDLRYQVPKSVRRPRRRASGPIALPGNYTVRLTAHGKNSTQPLMVKMDPRVKAPQDALVRQFELASRLSAQQGEVSAAMQQIGELRKQIEARKKEASEKIEVIKALKELNQKLDALTETEGNGGFGLYGLALPDKEHAGLQEVVSALSGLAAIVQSADVAPTTDASTASEKWDKAAEEALARWTAFQRDELTSVNGVLQKAGLKPLMIGGAEATH